MTDDDSLLGESGVEKIEASELVSVITKRHPRLFNGIKKEKQEQIIRAFSVGFTQIQKHHSGPIPDPETLEHYARIIPDGAERIMAMAEKEQQFRQEFTNTRSRREMNQSGMGQILGFLIALGAIGGGIFLAYSGKETAGLAAIISAMVLLAGAFITGRIAKKETE